MSVYILSRVWQQSQSRNGDRLVLLAIADFADEKGRAYPSMASLSAKSNMDIRSVQRSVARLTELGELAVREGAGPHGVNVYYVCLPEAPPQPATSVDEELPAAIYLPEAPATPPANRHPRQIAAPANDPFTPGKLPPNPSENRQGKERERASRPPAHERLRTAPPDPRPDPMEHLQRPDGWPPVLGLGELDAPIAELYRAFREVRYPGRTGPILPSEIAKDLATLRELHCAGICPEQLAQTTRHALERFSRDRVSLASLARNWSSLTEEPDASPADTLGAGPVPVRTLRSSRKGHQDPATLYETQQHEIRQQLAELATGGR